MNANLVIFLCDGASYFALKDIVAAQLRHNATSISCLVRGGTILRSTMSTRVSAAYSEYREGIGRTMLESTSIVPMEREFAAFNDALNDLEPLTADATRLPRLYPGAPRPDCIAVTGLPLPVAQAISASAAPHDWYHGTFHVQRTRATSKRYFWDSLVPTMVVTDGVILRAYEDTPTVFEESAAGNPFFDSHYDPDWADGFFYEPWRDWLPFERRYADLGRPEAPTWNITEATVTLRASPAERVFELLPGKGVVRMSKVDLGDRPASVHIGEPAHQFPDPVATEAKVRHYCLNRSHVARKWRGFQAAGYIAGRDEALLSHLLCSAFYEDFHPLDIRATADGTLQFGLQICLPRSRGGAVQCMTAWHTASQGDILLSTAFVTGPCVEGDRTTLLPRSMIERPFDQGTIAFVETLSAEYGEQVRSSWYQTKGWLWVSHDDPVSASFARQLRLHRSETIFRRRRRAVTQFNLGLAIRGETQVAGALRRAQNVLGLLGVTSAVEVLGD